MEVARAIAPGRVQNTTPQTPVLTGMPVSGMAYLDRPNEAGYFIFPDLSVRHEGQYKLSFNLYEETKEDKDADIEPSNDPSMRRMSSAAAAAESSFDWRMELKSGQFIVYSAKKFPGLTESTDLSRTVAEQGCRVRIRRDVRMRRRDDKPRGDYGENEDEYPQRTRANSPSYDYKHQAAGQASLNASLHEDSQPRRGSKDLSSYDSPTYRSPLSSPTTPNAPPPTGGQLHWIPQGAYASVQAIQPPPPPSAPSSYSQPISAAWPNQGPSAPFHQQAPQGPPPPPPGNYAGFEDRQPFGQYRLSNNPPPQSYEADYRRSSFGGYHVPPASQGPQLIAPAVQNPTYHQQPMESSFSRNTLAAAYPSDYPDSVALAPLRAELPAAMSPLAPVKSLSYIARGQPNLAPAPSPMSNHTFDRLERSDSYNQYPQIGAEPLRSTNKRTHSEGFGTCQESLRNGRRPSAIDEEEKELALMTYKRADGRHLHRPPAA